MSTVNLGRRALSVAIDVAVSALWWIPFARIEHGPGAVRLSWFGWRAAIPVIITLAYFALLPMFAGATVGMLAMRLRTVVVPAGDPAVLGPPLTEERSTFAPFRLQASGDLPPPPGGDPPVP